MKNYRIVFMGTAKFAVPTLEKLIESEHSIISVYSSPSKKANRGMNLTHSPVSRTAKKFKIDLHTPDNLKSSDELHRLKDLSPDIIVVITYGLILPPEILSIPKFGCFNLHAQSENYAKFYNKGNKLSGNNFELAEKNFRIAINLSLIHI